MYNPTTRLLTLLELLQAAPRLDGPFPGSSRMSVYPSRPLTLCEAIRRLAADLLHMANTNSM